MTTPPVIVRPLIVTLTSEANWLSTENTRLAPPASIVSLPAPGPVIVMSELSSSDPPVSRMAPFGNRESNVTAPPPTIASRSERHAWGRLACREIR